MLDVAWTKCTRLSVATFAAMPLLLAHLAPAQAANSPALRLIKTIPINGTASNPTKQMFSFDISWVDPVNGLYFLADRSNAALDVIDTTGAFTGTADTLFGQIGGSLVGFQGDTGKTSTSGPDGVVSSFPCIFAGDGTSRVVSFNGAVSFVTPVSSASTGGLFRADEMAYDPTDGLLIAANNADDPPFSTIFTVNKSTCALSNPVKTTFTNFPWLGATASATNGVEQPVWDPTSRRFYVSVPEVNGPGGGGTWGGVARITTAGVIEIVYPIRYCQPAGLSVGPNGDLLVGCSTVFDFAGNACVGATAGGAAASCKGTANPQVAVCNPSSSTPCSGNSLVAISGPGGGDEVWFNKGDGNYYITGGNSTWGPNLGVAGSGVSNAKNALIQLLPTIQPIPAVTGVHGAGTGHSVAASPTSNHIYVPLPANTAYPNCAQGCVAVFSAQ
jgi:hypothetical protein